MNFQPYLVASTKKQKLCSKLVSHKILSRQRFDFLMVLPWFKSPFSHFSSSLFSVKYETA
jgi:hypothetical protein